MKKLQSVLLTLIVLVTISTTQAQGLGGEVTGGVNAVSVQFYPKLVSLANRSAEEIGFAEGAVANSMSLSVATGVRPTDFLNGQSMMWGLKLKSDSDFSLTDITIESIGSDAYPGGITNLLRSVWSFVATNAYAPGAIGIKADNTRNNNGVSLMVPSRTIAFSVMDASFPAGTLTNDVVNYFQPFPNWTKTLVVKYKGQVIGQKTLGTPQPQTPSVSITRNSSGHIVVSAGVNSGYPAGTLFQIHHATTLHGPFHYTGQSIQAGGSYTFLMTERMMFYRLFKP